MNKINEDVLHGNYGMQAVMSIILEIQKIKFKHEIIKFQWVKGHEDGAACIQNPAIYLNNKCDKLANQERENKQNELNAIELNLNTIVIQKNKALLGNAKKELDMQMHNAALSEHWMNRSIDCINECQLDGRRAMIKKNFQHRVRPRQQ